MSYQTVSTFALSNLSGITSSLIKRIEHNPFHPLATTVYFPDQYDELVSPTNDQMSPVLVEDETYAVSDILTGDSSLYLQHKPRFGTSIDVSSGTLGLKDYEHGIVYFTSLPTGDFTVQYLAESDKYYGEHLQVIQDILHKVQWLIGAGTEVSEGIKNAELFLDSLPAGLLARMPNAISFRAIDRDIEIRSSTDGASPNGTQHRITLGNGDDDVFVDARRFVVRRSVTSGPTPSYVDILLGDETGDFCSVAGDLDVTGRTVIGTSGSSANTGVPASSVTGFEATGEPYTQGSLKLAVHGDAVVYGDLHVLGQLVTYNIERNIQVNVFEDALEVGNDSFLKGDVRIGATTDRTLYVGGDTELTGELRIYGAGGKAVHVDTSIEFHDGGLKGDYQQCTIDDLDPSYMELTRTLMRSEYKSHYHNDALPAYVYQGTTTSSSANTELVDTAASSLTGEYPSGTYHSAKYDEGDYIAVVNNQRIPVKSFNPTTKTWTLARAVDGLTTIPSSTSFQIYHSRGHGNFIQAGVGLSVSIKGSEVFPFVGNARGIVKYRESDYTLAVPANSTVYIFMSTLVGVNGIDEDAPTFSYSTSNVEDDRSVLIGKVVTNGSAPTSIVCYDVNGQYDTGWVKFDAAATGNVQQAGNDYTISAYLGNTKRRTRTTVRGMIAANTGSMPDLTQLGVLAFDSSTYVKTLGDQSIVIKTSSGALQGISLPYWLRFTVG
jgi:hypothetical protein